MIQKPPGQKGTQKKFSTAWKRTFSLLSANAQSNKLNRWSRLPFCKRLRKKGTLEQTSKIRRRCGEVLGYALANWRAKYNIAPDLAIALNKPKKQYFLFLYESELPAFVSALENYQGSLVIKYATQLLMLTGGAQTNCLPQNGWSLIPNLPYGRYPKNE